MAVFGNVRDAALAPPPRIQPRERHTFERHLARHERRVDQARDGLDELALPVAFDAGDADNLAGAHVERHAIQNRAGAGAYREIAHAERHVAGFRGRLFDTEQYFASHHQPGQLRRARLLRLHAADDLTIPHHRHIVGNRQHFSQLVRDDDDRFPLLAHAAKDREELLHLLRCQNRGRLVQNQQLRISVQRLQQLDALLLSHRQCFDGRAGIDRELERLRQAANAGGGLLEIERRTEVSRARLQGRCFRRRSSCRPA